MIQLQVLNYILKNKDSSLITSNNLNDSYFSNFKKEFNYIKTHLDTYNVIPDLETFLSVFNDFEVIEVNEPKEFLLKELYDEYKTRKLAETFNKVKDLLLSGKTEEAIRLYQNAYDSLNVVAKVSCVDILSDLSRYDLYEDKINNFDKYYVSTGFKEIDDLIGGWERNEELATIVARTGQGKSWVLLKCAVAAAKQGLTVGVYSGEMSETKVGYRIDTLLSHISNGSMMHGNAQIKDEYKAYLGNIKNIVSGSLKILTPAMIGHFASVNDLRAFIENEKLDILFIDQHSLLEDDKKARVPNERAANISLALKNLQVLKHIPIIAISQQNRQKNEDGSQDTTQIAQSDRIGQDTTLALFVETKDNIMKITFGKCRDNGCTGKTLSYIVDLNKGEWKYVPSEEDVMNNINLEENYESRYDEPISGEDVF